jgi:GNAT superfamily N-acetyltransferase
MATYRAAEVPDAPALSQLARRALQPYALPGWTRPAIERLLNGNSETALRDSLPKAAFAHVGLESGSVVGFIASASPRLVGLLVVDPLHQRHGIGSRLLEAMFEFVAVHAPEVSIVEINATQYSLPFYRHHGFYPLSEFIDHDGCRFARLGYWRNNPLLIR